MMKRLVTPYRLAQLPTFRMRVQLPSSGQTENNKSRGRVCTLDGMNRLSERKSEPMENWCCVVGGDLLYDLTGMGCS